MSDEARQRADRIQEKISILKVLIDYGYDVQDHEVQQQFSCDLHGMGDGTPSARVYPESNDWYCFGCGEHRDAIATVMAKEGMEFWPACRHLEKQYGLSTWQSDWRPQAPRDPRDIIKRGPVGDFKGDRRQTEHLLLAETQQRNIPKGVLLPLWEEFDKVGWEVHQEILNEKEGRHQLATMRKRVILLAAKHVV